MAAVPLCKQGGVQRTYGSTRYGAYIGSYSVFLQCAPDTDLICALTTAAGENQANPLLKLSFPHVDVILLSFPLFHYIIDTG